MTFSNIFARCIFITQDGLPAVCLYNVLGRQKYSSTSFYNEEEAEFVCHLISWLLANGVERLQIGVITLYKSQVYKIQSTLSQTSGYCIVNTWII